MKRLSLSEIISLPKASVIWREEHTHDDESGYNFYEVEPMLLCVAGEGGVLVYANKDSVLDLDIDENLITDERKFWDEEPGRELIEGGLPVKYFDSFNERYNIRRVALKGLLSEITKTGYTLDHFSQETAIALDDLRSVLIGEKELSPAEKEIMCALLNVTDDHVFDNTGKGKINELKKAAPCEGDTESCRMRI